MNVEHQPDAERFVARVDGHEAEVNYHVDDGVMAITHTGVPEAIGGRGVASEMIRAAFDHARQQGLRVRPLCSYAAQWAQRHHDDVSDLLIG